MTTPGQSPLTGAAFVRACSAYPFIPVGLLMAFIAGAHAAPAAAQSSSELRVIGAKYFESDAGSFLSVEVFDGQVSADGADGPTVSFAWRTATGAYGADTVIPRHIDAALFPVYLYNRALVRISAAAVPMPPPVMIRVTSNTGAAVEAPVQHWLRQSPPPMVSGYLSGFTTHYMDPVEVANRFAQLAAQYPSLAGLVNLPNVTQGYRRAAMCVMNAVSCGSTPSTTDQASTVYLEAKLYGHQGGNNIRAQFANPGTANAPLSVTVTPNAFGQSDIRVNLATNAAGALASTAAQVVAAINAHPSAFPLVTAYRYASNAGAGVVQPRALVNLSDFLAAPGSVPRGAFQSQVLRIGKVRDGSKVGVFVYCQQSGSDWVAPLVCVETAEQLLRNYATNPSTKAVLDNLEVFIVPVANPDGALYSMYDFSLQRKNMTRYCAIGSTGFMPGSRNSWGVNLNRNRSVGSLFDGYLFGSATCTAGEFAGPFELSEPESRNLQWIVDTFPNIKFSMNVESYGGFLTWSPGTYRSGRETLPPLNVGADAYFLDVADFVLTLVRNVRGTAVLPSRVGTAVDVRFPMAGNSMDDELYRRGILAFTMTVGADRFSSTTSGTGQFEVGMQPNYAAEGHYEVLEFSAGIFGLLWKALGFATDTTAPIADIVPNGSASRTAIDATFRYVNEPSVIYYTLDGSTPTFASSRWDAARSRLPGDVLQFTTSTTVKWIAVDMKGNPSAVRSAAFIVDSAAPLSTAVVSPAASNGWYARPTITLTATDGTGVGVDFVQYRINGGAWTPYTNPIRVTRNGNNTIEYQAVDLVGNTETLQTLAVNADNPLPVITVQTPVRGSTYFVGTTVLADYECTDRHSGVAGCTGTVVDGTAIDTSQPGQYEFVVTAHDLAGNTRETTVRYQVVTPFLFGGFRDLQNPPGLNDASAGDSLKVKFFLGGNRGLQIFRQGYPASAPIDCSSLAVTGPLAPTTAQGNEPLKVSGDVYTYSWKPDQSWLGTCRVLVLKFLDASEARTYFQFR